MADCQAWLVAWALGARVVPDRAARPLARVRGSQDDDRPQGLGPAGGPALPVWYDPSDPDEFAFAISDGSEDAREQIVAVFGDAFGADGSGVGLPVAPPDADPLTGA